MDVENKDPLAELAATESKRKALVEQLKEERASLVARIAEIDRVLGTKATTRGYVQERSSGPTMVQAVRDFIEKTPGCTPRQIREATGLIYPEYLVRMVQRGIVRREGPPWRYFALDATAPGGDDHG